MLLKVGVSLLAAIVVYCLLVATTFKFFLSDVIFLRIPPGITHESQALLVGGDGFEVLVRQYQSKGSRCAIFFPGQRGGISRYEREVLRPAVDLGITLYAISYPGYEGATGKATFESVRASTRLAIDYIQKNSDCKVADAVFIGRSLGSALALDAAVTFKPKGLLLDSASPSLGPVVKTKMAQSRLLWPAQFLPIDKLLEFDLDMDAALQVLLETPVVIFQGQSDTLTEPEIMRAAVQGRPNVEFIVIGGASHTTVVVNAGVLYFQRLCHLLACDMDNGQR